MANPKVSAFVRKEYRYSGLTQDPSFSLLAALREAIVRETDLLRSVEVRRDRGRMMFVNDNLIRYRYQHRLVLMMLIGY